MIASYFICLLLSVGSSYAAWQQSAEGLNHSKIKKTEIHVSPDSSLSQAKKKGKNKKGKKEKYKLRKKEKRI